MPFYSQEEIAGMRWITNEFQRIAHQKGVIIERLGWEEFLFYVQHLGNHGRRGVEFSHAEVQDCSHAVASELRSYLSSLLGWLLMSREPEIVRLYDRKALEKILKEPASRAKYTHSEKCPPAP
jgi:hypothetical protein